MLTKLKVLLSFRKLIYENFTDFTNQTPLSRITKNMKTNNQLAKIVLISIFILTFLFFSFSLTSCNKKDSNSTTKASSPLAKGIEAQPSQFNLLKKIPKNSIGYLTWNFTTDSFVKFKILDGFRKIIQIKHYQNFQKKL